MSLFRFNQDEKKLGQFYAREAERVKEVQRIILSERKVEISEQEAKQIIRGLSDYYTILADGRRITNAGLGTYCE